LPNALLEAGARAVIAVSVDNIPDQESAAFFAAVREQIRAGAKPAVAVRDQRVAWKREGKGLSWIGGVLVFE
ncbi:MAG TPA: hypothetical protein VK447_12620, partial [Myxococcaceae bacterium]|nr:hypothetical protein [Myxococcaceae bacterium]